jgi:hypothetical protein
MLSLLTFMAVYLLELFGCYSINDLFKILGIEQREKSFGFIELKFVYSLCF